MKRVVASEVRKESGNFNFLQVESGGLQPYKLQVYVETLKVHTKLTVARLLGK
jgi:hypothetical protein